jgi:NAD(P)-dependent dehydrogenase (short-subunit alcohol dehydrogenase family)
VRLEGRVCVVTGGAQGIGAASVSALRKKAPAWWLVI